MDSNGGVGLELIHEKVTFAADTSHADRFLPRVAVTKSRTANGRTTHDKSFRPFEAPDMTRVLDFNELSDPPNDTTMRVCEDAGTEGLKFPVRHVSVRGGFLFYFDVEDVEDGHGHFVSYRECPLGVVPLDKVDVATPPGGRRVFREHAHTDAKYGYEFVVIHAPDEFARGETTRPAAFFVAESLALRETWIKALKARAEVSSETKLRPNVGTRKHGHDVGMIGDIGGKRNQRSKRGGQRRGRDDADDAADELEKKDIEMAKQEFGIVEFSDDDWVNDFFAENNDFEAGTKIDQLEQWQASIKRGLRGAVLEQYWYFVQASGEMTTMGKEVNALKTMVETQNEIIKEMKEIDFTTALHDADMDSLASNDDELLDPPHLRAGGRKARRRRVATTDDHSEASSLSSDEDMSSMKKSASRRLSDDEGEGFEIEIPSWLDDVSEEISAFIKECRYTDATDLLFKARNEVNEILNLHEQPGSDNKLTKKQHANMQNIMNTLDSLSERMCNRLVESLRRKNEALKQAGKRERSDPLSLMAPMVSPCCLGDDTIPLHLLVKLGKTQEAATAYAARRSLLLLESLHERPISGTGNVDLVIYAAQLSQSFFSCLAGAVEGFLDLFFVNSETPMNGKDDRSLEDTASMLSSSSRHVPPGALASIVLWCDSELSKFSSAFSGTRILGNLALSPPPRQEPSIPKVRMVGFEDEASQTNKERQSAIEVAAQCVGQAFQYASENLDSIGLPLTPRLAEYIRNRLKGCEAEVAKLLDDKWQHITFEWEIEADPADIPMDERRMIRGRS